MRRTMFVVPVEDAPILHAAASLAVARRERRRNEELVALLGVDDVARWMREAEAATLAALERRGEATAQELAKDVPALRRKVRVNVGQAVRGGHRHVEPRAPAPRRRGQGRARPAARDVDQQPVPLGADGSAGSAARCPSWRSRRPRPSSSAAGWRDSARARRRTSAGGPAGRCARSAPRWRRSAPSRSTWTGRSGFVLPDDLEATPAPEPWVALLPSLDPTTMGWQVARLVPGRPQARPVRHERQRRADHLGRRADRRRLGDPRRTARSSRSCSRTSGARRRPRSTPRRRD